MALSMDVTSDLDQEKAEEAGNDNEAINNGMKEEASSPFKRQRRACRLINPSQRRSSPLQSRWMDQSRSLMTMEPRRRKGSNSRVADLQNWIRPAVERLRIRLKLKMHRLCVPTA